MSSIGTPQLFNNYPELWGNFLGDKEYNANAVNSSVPSFFYDDDIDPDIFSFLNDENGGFWDDIETMTEMNVPELIGQENDTSFILELLKSIELDPKIIIETYRFKHVSACTLNIKPTKANNIDIKRLDPLNTQCGGLAQIVYNYIAVESTEYRDVNYRGERIMAFKDNKFTDFINGLILENRSKVVKISISSGNGFPGHVMILLLLADVNKQNHRYFCFQSFVNNFTPILKELTKEQFIYYFGIFATGFVYVNENKYMVDEFAYTMTTWTPYNSKYTSALTITPPNISITVGNLDNINNIYDRFFAVASYGSGFFKTLSYFMRNLQIRKSCLSSADKKFGICDPKDSNCYNEFYMQIFHGSRNLNDFEYLMNLIIDSYGYRWLSYSVNNLHQLLFDLDDHTNKHEIYLRNLLTINEYHGDVKISKIYAHYVLYEMIFSFFSDLNLDPDFYKIDNDRFLSSMGVMDNISLRYSNLIFSSLYKIMNDVTTLKKVVKYLLNTTPYYYDSERDVFNESMYKIIEDNIEKFTNYVRNIYVNLFNNIESYIVELLIIEECSNPSEENNLSTRIIKLVEKDIDNGERFFYKTANLIVMKSIFRTIKTRNLTI